MKLILLLFSLQVIIQSTTGQTTGDNKSQNRFNRTDFKPTVYYREYSSANPVSMKIKPGDTINTESVDAGGFDKEGQKKSERGNPLTGPFFIESVAAGDAIAVTITKITMNRNYATTLEGLVPKSLPGNEIKKKWRYAKLARWNIDLENNVATPANQHEHINKVKIPLHPFLGCVGVAPEGSKKIGTGGFGQFGGNLDFKFITESATLYLPVYHNGALLLVGDGHAVQGDGELNGDALETSMNFEFTVRVIKNGAAELAHPRVEDKNYVMAFGIEKNLDRALQSATQNLLDWLQKDYQLSYIEATQIIGTSVQYVIPKIAATEVEMVAMLPKEVLNQLKKYN
jgi:acetamidase/formamidase